jgi:hypothetical protein
MLSFSKILLRLVRCCCLWRWIVAVVTFAMATAPSSSTKTTTTAMTTTRSKSVVVVDDRYQTDDYFRSQYLVNVTDGTEPLVVVVFDVVVVVTAVAVAVDSVGGSLSKDYSVVIVVANAAGGRHCYRCHRFHLPSTTAMTSSSHYYHSSLLRQQAPVLLLIQVQLCVT